MTLGVGEGVVVGEETGVRLGVGPAPWLEEGEGVGLPLGEAHTTSLSALFPVSETSMPP